MRRPIVAGNWKMHGTVAEAVELASAVVCELDGHDGADVVVCPPFTALAAVAETLAASPVELGAQNVHWESAGAFTGEVSAQMIADAGCRYVILGHSERRTYFGETDDDVRRKAGSALDAGLTPIVCVGETLAERDAGRTEDVVRRQVENGLTELAGMLGRVVIAYEPVWAIGTGRTASADQAQAVHALIRTTVRRIGGDAAADATRIQYGGSVKPDNAGELFARPDLDGGLIGGAALDAGSFARIVRAAG